MSVGNSSNTSFPKIADRPQGAATADKLDGLYNHLRNSGARVAAERLKAIDARVGDTELNFDGLERHINPDRTVDELNFALGQVRYAHLARNVFAIAPLIFTRFMLGLAAWQYNSDLNAHPERPPATTVAAGIPGEAR